MNKFEILKKELFLIVYENDRETRQIIAYHLLDRVRQYQQKVVINKEDLAMDSAAAAEHLIHAELCHKLADELVKKEKIVYEPDCLGDTYALDILVLI